jgi:hypothetical protein
MWFLHRHLDSFIMMGQLCVIYRDSAIYQLYRDGRTRFRQPGLCKNYMTVYKLKRLILKQIADFPLNNSMSSKKYKLHYKNEQ